MAGLEGDLQWSGRAKQWLSDLRDRYCTITASEKIDAFATLRARAGVAFDAVYLYGTAGGAWTNASTSVNVSGRRRVRRSEPLRQQGGLDSRRRRRICAREQLDGQDRVSLYRHRQPSQARRRFQRALAAALSLRPPRFVTVSVRIGFNYRFPFAPWPLRKILNRGRPHPSHRHQASRLE